MRDNEDFARGRLRYQSGNKKILDDMWNTITTALNACGSGPRKQPKEWQKTWRDWKSNVLKKCAQNKSHASETGGGPPKILQLTELEENLLEIIDAEAAGLNNIPEGGNFNSIQRTVSTDSNFTPEKMDLPRGRLSDIIARIKRKYNIDYEPDNYEPDFSNRAVYNTYVTDFSTQKYTSKLDTNKKYKTHNASNDFASSSTSKIVNEANFCDTGFPKQISKKYTNTLTTKKQYMDKETFNETNFSDTEFSTQETGEHIYIVESEEENGDIIENTKIQTTTRTQIAPNKVQDKVLNSSKENIAVEKIAPSYLTDLNM